MQNKKEIAAEFGLSLDRDDFGRTAELLSDDCTYEIGNEVLIGPKEICQSYEQNMIEGRKKLDQLEWGESRIVEVNEHEYYVHFTDYLTHQNKKYIHRCRQLLVVGDEGRITSIRHITDAEEQQKLDAFYLSVGLK